MRNLGGPSIPPRVRDMILTDRADGKFWAIHQNGERLLLTDDISGFRGDIFAAFDGPCVGNLELFIRSGRLGFEISSTRANRPVFAPNKVNTRADDVFFEVVKPSSFNQDYRLAYETDPD